VRYDDLVTHAVLRPLAALLLLAGGGAAAYEPTLDLTAIADAIRIGESRIERTRVQFHQPYRIRVGRAPVDTIDLVTPFRRLVIAVEEHMRQGGRSFRQQDGQVVLAQHGPILDVIVGLTFHPHNAYVGVPSYEVALARAAPRTPVPPVRVERVPHSGPRLQAGPTASPYPGPWDGGAMLGGTVIASFETTRIEQRARYDVVVSERGKELARITVDLASLR
jgi:hypothetical protein